MSKQITKQFIKYAELIGCFANILLFGMHEGFELGYQELRETCAVIHLSGGTAYEFLAKQYLYITFLFLIFLVAKLVKPRALSHFISIFALIWISYFYWQTYLQKRIYFGNSENFSRLIRESIPIDLLSFSLVLILSIIQVSSVIQCYFEWKRNKLKVE